MIRRVLLAGGVAVMLWVSLNPPEVSVEAHEGEQHGSPAATVGGLGPVTLGEDAKRNLGVKVEEVGLRTINTLVHCFGIVEPLPDKVSWITTRFAGRMLQVFVNAGEKVQEGDRLARAESRQIGNPPPQVDIVSTLTGTVTERNVVAGQPFEPSSILFRIMELSTVFVKCHVYETDIGRVAVGQRVTIYPEAFGGKRRVEGTVRTIGGQLDERTRTLPVWVAISNKDLVLQPGMRTQVEIVVGQSRNVVAAPLTSVLGEAGNYFVFLDRGRDYVGQPIGLGRRDDRYVEVVQGLFPGDRVVTQGGYQIQFAATTSPLSRTASIPKKTDPASGGSSGTRDMAEGTPARGVTLSALAQRNLGLRTVEVDIGTIDQIMTSFGHVEANPEAVYQISTRTSGNVIKVLVNEGEAVEEHELLAVIESRKVGNPPPHIQVYATRSGIVTDRHVFMGEPVEADKTLFTLIDLLNVLVKAHVYEADTTRVRLGQEARVYTQAYPGEAFVGVVERIGGQIEEETRTLPVWIRVKNPALRLRPYMRARIALISGKAVQGIAIPREAVLEESAEGPFVFVQEGEFFKLQLVTLGSRDDRSVEIIQGLLPGDQVVVEGNRSLEFATNSLTPPSDSTTPSSDNGATPTSDVARSGDRE